jgi:branched-chain amino acid transport system permease protein
VYRYCNGARFAPDVKTEAGLNHLSLSKSRKFATWLGALAIIFGTLFSAMPASAADASPSPEPETALIIKGKVKNEGVGVAGIGLSISGPSFSGKATTDEAGTWSIEVPTKAVYDVEIDLATLPEGVSLRDPDTTVRQADVTMVSSASVLFPLGVDTRVQQSLLDQTLVRLFAGLNLGLLLAVAAIGISLIFGTTGLNNFAHGEMVTLGALLTWVFYSILGMPLILSVVLTMIATAIFGWVQDAGLWRPLRKRRLGLNQMMIVSIGFSIVLRYILLLFFDGDTKVISGDFQTIELGPVITTANSIGSMAISIVTLAAVALFLTRTRIGKATRAVSDNASLAASTGIDVERIIRIVWVVSGALTGLAGILYGLQFQASWLTGFQILLLLFAAVTLGGLGTALGATVGALIIGFVVELSSLVLPSDLKYAASLIILILVLLVRPQGVLGKKQRIG